MMWESDEVSVGYMIGYKDKYSGEDKVKINMSSIPSDSL